MGQLENMLCQHDVGPPVINAFQLKATGFEGGLFYSMLHICMQCGPADYTAITMHSPQ